MTNDDEKGLKLVAPSKRDHQTLSLIELPRVVVVELTMLLIQIKYIFVEEFLGGT